MINEPPLQQVKFGVPFVDKNGSLTNTTIQTLQGWYNQINGGIVGVPCIASGTNIITLMPADVAPVVQQYWTFMCVAFQPIVTTTGLVTMGYSKLPAVNVYKANGATQAGANDLVKDLMYLAFYVDSLNSGVGGWVLK